MIKAKNFRMSFILFVLIGAWLIPSYVVQVYAAPPIPFRIGGTVTIDDIAITEETDTGLTIKVKKINGTDYTPAAQDADGLNTADWYLIDIPIFNAADQPGGANTGDIAVVHIYLNGNELPVISPANAQLTVGKAASNFQIDLVAVSSVMPVINSFSASPASITSGGSSTLSWTITGAESASIDNGVGTVSVTTGSITVSPDTTATYTLTATNASGSAKLDTTVSVQSATLLMKANGKDGQITVSSETPVSITASLAPGGENGKLADWWLAASTPWGWYSLDSNGWTPGINLLAQDPLFDIAPVEIISSALPVGNYDFYFVVDMSPNGNVDPPFYYDFVQVHIVN